MSGSNMSGDGVDSNDDGDEMSGDGIDSSDDGHTSGDGVDSSDDGSEKVTVNVRFTNGSKSAVQVTLNSTVKSFKSFLAQKCRIPAHQQRLIFKGRVLKAEDQTLKSYGLEADHTVHLVRVFATSAAAENATTTYNGSGMFGVAFSVLEEMLQMLTQNPKMIRDISNMPDVLNNPETIRNLITSSPRMREIMDRSPELARMLNDPATLRQTIEATRNPEIMREMARNADRVIMNIESSSRGFDMLRRRYENVQEHFFNETPTTGGDRIDLGLDSFPPLSAALGGENSTPNTNPLPNPWANADAGRSMPRAISGRELSLLSSPHYMNQQPLNTCVALSSQGSGEAVLDDGGSVAPEELYASQLSKLRKWDSRILKKIFERSSPLQGTLMKQLNAFLEILDLGKNHSVKFPPVSKKY